MTCIASAACRSDKGCKLEGPVCSDFYLINRLILSITKFSVVIGSLHAYSSCDRPDHVGVQLHLSNYSFL